MKSGEQNRNKNIGCGFGWLMDDLGGGRWWISNGGINKTTAATIKGRRAQRIWQECLIERKSFSERAKLHSYSSRPDYRLSCRNNTITHFETTSYQFLKDIAFFYFFYCKNVSTRNSDNVGNTAGLDVPYFVFVY